MQKFRLLVDHLSSEGILTSENQFEPEKLNPQELYLVHDESYVRRFVEGEMDKKEIRKMGLPWSEALVHRSLISPSGSLLTARMALEHGMACHLAGGTHHAHYGEASGFCIFNDLAFAAKKLLSEGECESVLIYDLDVHQGDGTAKLLENEERAFTCSIHGEKNFPLRKANSDLDIGCQDGMEDEVYLPLVKDTLEKILEDSRPDLLIYDAGVDIYSGDPLGRLEISLEGIRKRDRLVLEVARNASIPVATVIGGGYDNDEVALALRHAIVVEEAYDLLRSDIQS